MMRYFFRTRKQFVFPAVTCVAVALSFFPAHADAIDGHWCNAKGKILHIEGTAIVTPGGVNVVGDYRRHSFSYVSPGGDDHAGETLHMTLLSDDLVDMEVPGGDLVAWRRCDIVS